MSLSLGVCERAGHWDAGQKIEVEIMISYDSALVQKNTFRWSFF